MRACFMHAGFSHLSQRVLQEEPQTEQAQGFLRNAFRKIRSSRGLISSSGVTGFQNANSQGRVMKIPASQALIGCPKARIGWNP